MVRPPALVGIVGWKNSGKTTLIERLIPLLSQLGLKVMTVKHTHHELGPLTGSSDGERHARAGVARAGRHHDDGDRHRLAHCDRRR